MGRKPKPTALLERQGTLRKCRRRGEPEVPPGCPEPPAWLTDEVAVEEWEYTVEHLGGYGILTAADRTALAMYCQEVANYVAARQTIAKLSPEDAARAVRRTGAAFDRATKLAREFGMTPSSRAGLHVQAKPAEPAGKGRFFKVVG